MKNGTFVYPSWRDGRPVHLRVRECPNPAAVREMLERLMERPVKWLEHRA